MGLWAHGPNSPKWLNKEKEEKEEEEKEEEEKEEKEKEEKEKMASSRADGFAAAKNSVPMGLWQFLCPNLHLITCGIPLRAF